MSLAIIVPRFNPCGYIRPRRNFSRFVQGLALQCSLDDLFVPEALFWGAEPEWKTLHVPAGLKNFMWQKEALINLAVSQLPAAYDAVAWVDGDLLFENAEWVRCALAALESYPVVQLFEEIVYLDHTGRPAQHGWGAVAAGSRLGFRNPGAALAARRDVIARGLYPFAVLGGGDDIFLKSLAGTSVGFIPGRVRHLFHGVRALRRYLSRHEILARHRFDPAADVRIGENGLVEWVSENAAMHADVRRYFRERREDSR